MATVATLDTSHPGDMAALERWLENNPDLRPRCVLGKTEGNGCVNDFTRAYASSAVESVLGDRRNDASIIMSGGTEGVLTPHLLMFADSVDAAAGAAGSDSTAPASSSGRLSLGVARTRVFAPHEIGRQEQAEATRDAVLLACADAGLEPTELCFAQVKCPLLTPERVAAADAPCTTEDGYHSMGLSRAASAIGVALATGEVSSNQLPHAIEALCTPTNEYRSAVASASAGIELMHSEIFVLGNSDSSTSSLRYASTVSLVPRAGLTKRPNRHCLVPFLNSIVQSCVLRDVGCTRCTIYFAND